MKPETGGKAAIRALQIAGVYATLAVAWIVFSDAAVTALVDDEQSFRWLQSAKGVGFVLVTGVLLLLVLQREFARADRVLEENRESRRQLSALLATLPGMVYRSLNDRDWTMLFVSRGVERLTGYSREDFINRHVSYGEIIHRDDRELVSRVVQEALARRRPFQVTYRIQHKDGGQQWVWEQGRGVFDDVGKVEFLEGLVLDVTEGQEAKEEMVRARDEAVQALQVKSTFFANMSHEVRTPVNVLLGSAEMLKEEIGSEVSPMITELVHSMDIAGQRLLDTIDRILDVTKIESGSYVLRKEEVDLSAIVAELVGELRPLALEKKIDVAFESHVDAVKLRVDRYAIESALSNVIDNAIKFTKEGMILVTLIRTESGRLRLEVSDTGIGISREYLPRVFDSFSQEQAGMSRPYEGSGLGLAVAKGFLDLHGATIRTTSEQGKGATFVVEFPRELEINGDDVTASRPKTASG